MHQTLLDPAGAGGLREGSHCWRKEVTVACSTNLLPSLFACRLPCHVPALSVCLTATMKTQRVHSSAAPLKNWESDGTEF